MKTEKKVTHTPTPWRFNQSEYNAHSSLCEIRGPNDAYSITRDTSWANAEFIVRAVNSHKALLDALKEAKDVLESFGERLPILTQAKINKALAQAEGK